MDASELIAALEADPRAIEMARRLILTDELLSLPALVAENTRAIAELRQETAELREAVAENTRAIAELRQETAELREAVTGLREAVAGLRAAVEDIGRHILLLGDRWSDVSGSLDGLRLELAYRNHPYGYFGKVIRRARTLGSGELADLLGDAVDQGLLTDDEAGDVALADLIVAGRHEGGIAYLVVEVSRTIRSGDVSQAVRRAALLSRLGDPAMPVVAGDAINGPVTEEATDAGVSVLLDGRKVV